MELSQSEVDSMVNYDFNYGEGTQRIVEEYAGKKAQESGHIFVTHHSWKNIGGIYNHLKGVSQNFFGARGTRKVTIHGPQELVGMLNINETGYGLVTNIGNIESVFRPLEEGFFEDESFRIEYVQLDSERSPSDLDATQRIAVAYIAKPKENEKRHVLSWKCMEHNIRSQKHLQQLMNGESVVLDNGKTVVPDDILRRHNCIKPIIVIECPNTNFINSLLEAEKIKKHRYLEDNKPDSNSEAKLVIHMTPEHIIKDKEYQNFIFSFGNRTRHLILNESTSAITLRKCFQNQRMFNTVNEDLFPLLGWQNKYNKERKNFQINFIVDGSLEVPGESNYHMLANGKQAIFSLQRNNVTSAEEFCKFKDFWWEDPNINIRHLFQTSNVIKAVPGLLICFSAESADFMEKSGSDFTFRVKTEVQNTVHTVYKRIKESRPQLEKLQEKVNEFKNVLEGPKYPEVVFLGTSSQSSSPYRNVSSYLLHIDEDTVIVLDCGDDTIGQIYRFYGEQTPELLTKIKGIFISHFHADHYLGMFGLLEERNRVLKETNCSATPVILIGPKQLETWFKYYELTIEPLRNFKFCALDDAFRSYNKGKKYGLQEYDEIINHFKVKVFKPVKVPHVRNSYGVVVVDRNKKKFVYSGDTVLSKNLVYAGANCDLLIHEATFADCHGYDAYAKRHCTIDQAIVAALKMKAHFTILTHFSRKYIFPMYGDELRPDLFGIGFDFLKVNLSNVKVLGLHNEYWKMAFEDELDGLHRKFHKGDCFHILKENDFKDNERYKKIRYKLK